MKDKIIETAGKTWRFLGQNGQTNVSQLAKSLKEKNEVDGPIFKIKQDPRITRLGQFLRKYSGKNVDMPRYLTEPVGAVINGVHPCHDGQQGLGSANVRSCPLPLDMLLAGLQCHAERTVSLCIY